MISSSPTPAAPSTRWFDSHCHLDAEAFNPDRQLVLERAFAAGVTDILIPGVLPRVPLPAKLASSTRAATQQLPRLYQGVGLHPFALGGGTAANIDGFLEALSTVAQLPHFYFIGECGLDKRFAKRSGIALPEQERVFDFHVRASEATGKPLVVHVVGAHGRLLQRLRKSVHQPGGVVHWYSGSKEQVTDYAELGFYFGFGASCLTASSRKHDVLRAVPPERLLLETDAPDQPLRVKPPGPARNEPSMLPRIGKGIAEILGVSANELAELSGNNARRLFRLPPAET